MKKCQKCRPFEALYPLISCVGISSVEEFEQIIQTIEKYKEQYRAMFICKSGMNINSTFHYGFLLGGAGN